MAAWAGVWVWTAERRPEAAEAEVGGLQVLGVGAEHLGAEQGVAVGHAERRLGSMSAGGTCATFQVPPAMRSAFSPLSPSSSVRPAQSVADAAATAWADAFRIRQ